MRYHSYLNTAKRIIESYKGEEPLAGYLRKFFAADKKYGSKDRRHISSLCYNYYRLGKAAPDVPLEEKLLTATFLCEDHPSEILHAFRPEWNQQITLPIRDKLSFLEFSSSLIFPFTNELSDGIEIVPFALSFLQQPDLFLRIRPGKKTIVESKLKSATITYRSIDESCIALPNSSKVNDVLVLDKEAVVQDINSQKVLNSLRSKIIHQRSNISSWDCCAASGGKSILLYDILNGNVQLTVSDIRESILSNLKKRFSVAGIKNYHAFIADLNAADKPLFIKQPELIICDAPCTGSGTWARTPEQLFYFDQQQIEVYAERQRRIVSNVIPYLKDDGLFVYITCSVFASENEDVVQFIKEKFHLQLLQMELLKGYTEKGDSMFVAVFKKLKVES